MWRAKSTPLISKWNIRKLITFGQIHCKRSVTFWEMSPNLSPSKYGRHSWRPAILSPSRALLTRTCYGVIQTSAVVVNLGPGLWRQFKANIQQKFVQNLHLKWTAVHRHRHTVANIPTHRQWNSNTSTPTPTPKPTHRNRSCLTTFNRSIVEC